MTSLSLHTLRWPSSSAFAFDFLDGLSQFLTVLKQKIRKSLNSVVYICKASNLPYSILVQMADSNCKQTS